MKKIIFFLVVLFLIFGISSCATGPKIDTKDIPAFYLNPPVAEDSIYGVGDAKLSSLSPSRTAAISRARDDIARQVEVLIKNAITDYAQEAGEGSNVQTIQFVETISRQVAEITLSGVRTVQLEVGKDGTVYALCMYPLKDLKETASEEFRRNESAAFAEFKAEKALEYLNFELENNPPQAGRK